MAYVSQGRADRALPDSQAAGQQHSHAVGMVVSDYLVTTKEQIERKVADSPLAHGVIIACFIIGCFYFGKLLAVHMKRYICC